MAICDAGKLSLSMGLKNIMHVRPTIDLDQLCKREISFAREKAISIILVSLFSKKDMREKHYKNIDTCPEDMSSPYCDGCGLSFDAKSNVYQCQQSKHIIFYVNYVNVNITTGIIH